MIERLLTQVAQVSNPTVSGVDAYNNPTVEFEPPVEEPCRLEQRSGLEQDDDRDVQIGDYLLISPPTSVVTGRSRVVVDGSTFEVVGPPIVQRTPRGPHHIESQLRHVDFG